MIISATGKTESIAQSNLAIKMDKLEESSREDIIWGERELIWFDKHSGYKYIQRYSLRSLSF